MEIQSKMLLVFALLLCSSLPFLSAVTLKDYIVHVQLPMNLELASHKDIEAYYHSFLPNVVAHTSETRMIHTYFHAITGFAAKLTEDEVNEMAKKEGFLIAQPSRLFNMLTTHTPDFLGLQPRSTGLWNSSEMGKGIIIGLIDSGIAPKHVSFKDDDMPPPPKKWKGSCKDLKPSDGRCNRKLIGARDFTGDNNVTDVFGHGTHTAATTVGNFVANADVLGNANGTASGMAPLAHLAVYKVCGHQECKEANIVAGMDAAIGDGVDVMSISLGSQLTTPFYDDSVAIAAYRATKKGIFMSFAAGNAGPGKSTVSNEAPWVLTVAAGTMDRSIKAIVKLGDGQEFEGQSLFQPHDFQPTLLPLAYPTSSIKTLEGNCNEDIKDVKGKVVLCHIGTHGREAPGYILKNLSAAAMILMNGERAGYTTLADAHVLPASHVSYADASKILSYFNSSTNATATIIFKGTIIGMSEAPTVAYFSSRGPGKQNPGILKPDILGPGVNVLAAWPFVVNSEDVSTNKDFNIISGTSMSTPHLSGIAALLKKMHHDWSPAAIKSAIMTTSMTKDHSKKPIKDENLRSTNFFVTGAGHVNPSKAVDPGLVFDINNEEYIAFLCGMGYSDEQVSLITGDDVQCDKVEKISQSELNYPAIITSKGQHVVVNRTVTNVGEATSTYKVEVNSLKEVIVEVTPDVLEFHELNEKKSYKVSINSSAEFKGSIHGNLKWVSDKYTVRTPIIVH